MATRMVITGAGGQVGGLLAVEAARHGYRVDAFRHRDLDITNAAAIGALIRRDDIVVNCAAMTNVDHCESDHATAFEVNASGPGNLAHVCATVGARLIHLSTDYVFAGDLRRPYEISDPTGPLGIYGHSKLVGESAVMSELPEAHVVRTSWVYTGGSGTDFVAVMRKLASTGRLIDVVDDQIGSPTYAMDLVSALLEIAAGGVRGGVLHVANEGAVSRFEQARAVFAELGADPDRVRPVSTAAFPRPARRPAYSALSMVQSELAGLSPLRPWRDALTAALAVPLEDGPIPLRT